MGLSRLLVIALVALGLVAASAADAGCRTAADEDGATMPHTCGLTPIGAVEVSTTAGIGQIAVHDRLAAVVQRDDGQVALLDLSDPAAPTVLGRFDGGTGVDSLDNPLDGDVAFSDDGAYVFYARQTSDASNEGLHVLDVSDPSNPTRVAFEPQGGMLRVAYSRIDGTEYVATLDAMVGLTIFRVDRSPAAPVLTPVHVDPLPELKVGGPASAGLVFTDDPLLGAPLLYVADGTTGLTVLDVSDPAQPSELGGWDDTGLAEIVVDHDPVTGVRRVIAAREYWFDDQSPPELVVLDAGDLGTITEVERVLLGPEEPGVTWRPQGMRLVDGRLHVALSHGGLVVLDADHLTDAPVATTTDLGEHNTDSPFRRTSPYAMDVHVTDDGLILVSDASTGVLSIFAAG